MTRWLIAAGITVVAGLALAEAPSRLAGLLRPGDDAGFARVTGPRTFAFPADHGPHTAFRNEWWYVTGNLDDAASRRFGFELTFFRFALAPEAADSASAWRTNQVYVAHLALTDAAGGRFHVAQRYSRGALGLAGAEADPFRVWIDDWSLAAGPDAGAAAWRIAAGDDAFGIDLELRPQRGPVLHGDDGLSRKSAEPGNASYYYSVTRLLTEGAVRVGDRRYAVAGLSWLDREWSTSALAADQVGWDWFALQLSDGSDLMFYSLRRGDGSRDPASAGTFVRVDGTRRRLGADDVTIAVLDTWTSPEGGTYPARWSLRVPRHGLDVTVTPVIPNQELVTTVRYWEGAVDVRGTRDGATIAGRGYVELTGYAE